MQPKTRVRFVNKDKTQFLTTLRGRVDAYFEEHNIDKKGNGTMVVKSIVVLSMYLLPIIALYVFNPLPAWTVVSCFIIAGFGLSGVGMSVLHDAIHGAYSNNKFVNTIMGNTLNMLGGYDVNWRLQHNVLHHTYTNITHVDEDIDQRLKMRWSPHHKSHFMQRYQHIYAFFAYCLATWSWTTIKDFKQLYVYNATGLNNVSIGVKIWQVVRLLFLKTMYYLYILIIPIYVLGYSGWLIIGSFMIMHFIGGFILSTIFQLAHVVEHAEFPMPNDQGIIENEWAIHQMQTTADFAHNNKILTWYAGGLTHQIEHHLFTDICHVHYPKIAHIVKQTAQEFGVPYIYNESYWTALQSHYRMLKKFGLPDGKFELANA